MLTIVAPVPAFVRFLFQVSRPSTLGTDQFNITSRAMIDQRSSMRILIASFLIRVLTNRFCCQGFQLSPHVRLYNNDVSIFLSGQEVVDTHTTIVESSHTLADWDRWFSSNVSELSERKTFNHTNITRKSLVEAVMVLNQKATEERSADATTGRCILGICASSAEEGIMTLKSWVSNLGVPRGLLHGMDVDGVAVEFKGGVYIKYNSGGVYTFADIRKSQMGFNAIWKPGDAMLEEYDGAYRGVYFQVELADGEFRQYLVPLDLFEDFSAS